MPDGSVTNVLWVCKGLGPGGMEQLLVNHARFADRREFRSSAAYVLDDKDQTVAALEALDVRCDCLHATSDLDVRWWLRLREVVLRDRIDVVHAHSPSTAVAARLVARSIRPRPAVVYTEHNSWQPYRWPSRWANAVTYLLDDRQLAVSEAAFESVPGPLRRHLEVLHHGIDIEEVRARGSDRAAARRELGVPDDRIVVGTVANLRPEKNYEGLLAVAAEVTAARADVSFVSIGQGPLEAALQRRSDELGLTEEQFRFRGYEPDAVRLMAGFDVFVLASHHEGLPVAFMEARALGLPVVCTAVGGLPEMVDPEIDGLLAPPGDHAALVAQLLRVVDDPELRRRLADSSAAAAKHVDAGVAVARIEQVYREALAARSR